MFLVMFTGRKSFIQGVLLWTLKYTLQVMDVLSLTDPPPHTHTIILLNQRSAIPPFLIHTCDKPYTYATYQKSFIEILSYSVVKRALCVGLWEGICWADQFEGTCETAHWTQKPFHCHCGESFTLKRDLKRHTERLHAETY
jgi:hypothetical protein